MNIEVEQQSRAQAINVYSRTEGDEVAEINTSSATDEEFAQFAPLTDAEANQERFNEPGLRRTIGMASMHTKHFVELAGGGEVSVDAYSVARRNAQRARYGIGPESK